MKSVFFTIGNITLKKTIIQNLFLWLFYWQRSVNIVLQRRDEGHPSLSSLCDRNDEKKDFQSSATLLKKTLTAINNVACIMM